MRSALARSDSGRGVFWVALEVDGERITSTELAGKASSAGVRGARGLVAFVIWRRRRAFQSRSSDRADLPLELVELHFCRTGWRAVVLLEQLYRRDDPATRRAVCPPRG